MAYDLVVRGGHTVDPLEDLDGPMDLAVEAGTIVRCESRGIDGAGREEIDATGLVVMPGIIDGHVHLADRSRGGIGHSRLALAGVTTAVEFSDFAAVVENLADEGAGLNLAGLRIIGPHTSRHIDRGLIAKEVRAVADSGALGVKIMGGHHPSSPEATEAMIEVANREDCYVAYHVGTTDSSSNLEGMRELPHIVGSNRLHLAHVNAYMRGMVRPIYEELAEGLEIIRQLKSVVSESHLAPFNGTSGAVDGDQLLDQVTVNCLRMAGYVPNRRGLEEALRDGYAAVNVPQDGRMVHLNGETGHRRWRELDGNCGLSFPVNRRITAMACALERRAGGEGEAGEFLIDALASDGGAWRNELLSRGLPLVEFGALSLQELVQKISTNPAKMFGFASKGTLREGSDADLTIVDVARRNVVATVVAGETVAREGRVLGEGGNLYTTDRGREALRRAGWISHMVDLAESSFYKKSVTTGEPGAGIE